MKEGEQVVCRLMNNRQKYEFCKLYYNGGMEFPLRLTAITIETTICFGRYHFNYFKNPGKRT